MRSRVLPVVVVLVALVGCGGSGPERSQEAFCDELEASRPAQAGWREFQEARRLFDEEAASRFDAEDAEALRAALDRVADATPEADAEAWDLWQRSILPELEALEDADFEPLGYGVSDVDFSANRDLGQFTPEALALEELTSGCRRFPWGEMRPDEPRGG